MLVVPERGTTDHSFVWTTYFCKGSKMGNKFSIRKALAQNYWRYFVNFVQFKFIDLSRNRESLIFPSEFEYLVYSFICRVVLSHRVDSQCQVSQVVSHSESCDIWVLCHQDAQNTFVVVIWALNICYRSCNVKGPFTI